MKELKWNRRHDFCYILYTQTGDKLKLEVVFVGGGVGQQLNNTPPPPLPLPPGARYEQGEAPK